jgi:hypothetical protein
MPRRGLLNHVASSVSSLVTLAGVEGEKPAFKSVIEDQIKSLRKQLDKDKLMPQPPPQPEFDPGYDLRGLISFLNVSAANTQGMVPEPSRQGGDMMPNDIFADIVTSSSRMLNHITGRG